MPSEYLIFSLWFCVGVSGENQDNISTGSEFSDTSRLVDDESDDGLDNAESNADDNEVRQGSVPEMYLLYPVYPSFR